LSYKFNFKNYINRKYIFFNSFNRKARERERERSLCRHPGADQ